VWSQEQEIQIKRHVTSYSASADTVGLNVTDWIHSVMKNNPLKKRPSDWQLQ